MNKRIKMFLTSMTLVLSMVVMGFGVLAASNHTLGVDNYITFDIEDNIACEIEAVTALGTSPDVAFSSDHGSNAKTLKLSVDMDSDSSAFTYLEGNTNLNEDGKWAPWTEEDPAGLTYSADTVYWLYKITNKSGNNIQVRITDSNDQTLSTLNSNMQLTKKFGNSADETPNKTKSGEIVKDQSVYVLIALEAQNIVSNLAEYWNYKIHITKVFNPSYFMWNWKNQIGDTTLATIKNIEFVGGDGNDYVVEDEANTQIYNLGAINESSSTALKGNESSYPNVNEVTGYLNGTTLTVHSKGTIYAQDGCANLFYNLNVETISFENFDTSKVIYMARMFEDCANLKELDLSGFDTSNVGLQDDLEDGEILEHMEYMFSGCRSLTKLDLSSFDTSNVRLMNNMFDGCRNLTKLDLSNFNTSNVTSMADMFNGCRSLTKLDLSNFNTSNVRFMDSMFYGCVNLTDLNLSGFYIQETCTVYAILNLQGDGSTTAITTLVTPYYIGTNIDITGLGLKLDGVVKTTITSSEANKTLTK